MMTRDRGPLLWALTEIETRIMSAADLADAYTDGRGWYWRAWTDDLRYLATRVAALREEAEQHGR